MDQDFEKTTEQAAAFQKLWMDSASKIMQAAFTITPNSPPPEIMRQIRAGIFQALASSWEEFMRSPQFLEGMKQWMENAITFRKMTTDFMARVRNEMQAPSRDDIDSVMLNIRHLEKRLLDRLDELATQVNAMNHPATGNGRARPRRKAATRKARAKAGGAPAQKQR
jgi:uncharacterized protein (DUF2267 family)